MRCQSNNNTNGIYADQRNNAFRDDRHATTTRAKDTAGELEPSFGDARRVLANRLFCVSPSGTALNGESSPEKTLLRLRHAAVESLHMDSMVSQSDLNLSLPQIQRENKGNRDNGSSLTSNHQKSLIKKAIYNTAALRDLEHSQSK